MTLNLQVTIDFKKKDIKKGTQTRAVLNAEIPSAT